MRHAWVINVVLGEAGAAEHCLAEIVSFNVLLECLGDMKTENIGWAGEKSDQLDGQ